ncbi:MAG: hypothetical protein OXC37_00650 [Bdellovibrionaceae bacterium]|nr:hypothetical protein [Pseudobdellovibrionaceae bacterium]
MVFLKKNKKSSVGQATIEYLLLIVLVIAIATGIGGPLGLYLKRFSGALLGPNGYYACLTERGLLPGDPRASYCNRHTNLALNTISSISFGPGFSDSDLGTGGDNNNTGINSNNSNTQDSSLLSGDTDEKSFKPSSKDKSKNPTKHKANRSKSLGRKSLSSPTRGAGEISEESSDSPYSFSAFDSKLSSKKRKKRKTKNNYKALNLQKEEGKEEFNASESGYKRARFRPQKAQGYLGEVYNQEQEKEQAEKPVFKVTIAKEQSKSIGSETKKISLFQIEESQASLLKTLN